MYILEVYTSDKAASNISGGRPSRSPSRSPAARKRQRLPHLRRYQERRTWWRGQSIQIGRVGAPPHHRTRAPSNARPTMARPISSSAAVMARSCCFGDGGADSMGKAKPSRLGSAGTAKSLSKRIQPVRCMLMRAILPRCWAGAGTDLAGAQWLRLRLCDGGSVKTAGQRRCCRLRMTAVRNSPRRTAAHTHLSCFPIGQNETAIGRRDALDTPIKKRRAGPRGTAHCMISAADKSLF
jgi:hypothetical protein